MRSDIVNLFPELAGTPCPPNPDRFGSDISMKRREWELANGRCPEVVSDRGRFTRFSVCARPIKTEGAVKCKMHLAVDRRAEEKEAQSQARSRANVNAHASASRLVAELGAFGITARETISSNPGSFAYTGGISMSGDEARKLLTMMEAWADGH